MLLRELKGHFGSYQALLQRMKYVVIQYGVQFHTDRVCFRFHGKLAFDAAIIPAVS